MSDKLLDASERDRLDVQACLSIADTWKVVPTALMDLLGVADERTMDQWRAGRVDELSPEIRERVGLMIGVDADLHKIFQNPNNTYGWVTRGNSDFEGKTPFDYMQENGTEGMHVIQRYLKSWMLGK